MNGRIHLLRTNCSRLLPNYSSQCELTEIQSKRSHEPTDLTPVGQFLKSCSHPARSAALAPVRFALDGEDFR